MLDLTACRISWVGLMRRLKIFLSAEQVLQALSLCEVSAVI